MRVVIAEDEPLLREGICAVLVRAGIQVVAAVEDADELLAQARAHRPELLLTDIRMPPGHRDDGLGAALRVRQELPGQPVMLLSQHASGRYARELLATGSGGIGYLLKQRVADTEQFVTDLRRVAAGGTVLDPEIASSIVTRATRSTEPLAGLTPRQREVLGLMAEGRTNAAIAQRLGITEKAITRHASTIYQGLGLQSDGDDHRRVLAVLTYLEDSAGHPPLV
ncbi:MAG: response regulator transcription factor [Solirubrobacteraceae bacterium]|nr:response regulator transcription factor [Solirubrobacteraceae bacterium]